MFANTLSHKGHGWARLCAALLMLAGLSGCYTSKSGKIRESRFINMDAEMIHVTYSEEKRTETLPNGLVCTFDGKIRLRLASGKTITLYQAMTASGVRYVSKNKRYEFIEKGPCCRLFYKGTEIFEGVYCRSQ
ncbi:MAG: MliC family protein [bacterium]